MNSPAESEAITAEENLLPVVPANTSLTLAAKKLAGSENCLNCNTELKGPFCYYCGQPDRNFMRFFPALLRDLMEDLLDFDSRFMRTLKPLLFKPGRLTKDFMSGRRFRYAPPMRLYIFSSIVFFLLAALLSSDLVTVSNNADSDSGTDVVSFSAQTDGPKQQIEGALDEAKQQVDEALNELSPELREQIVNDDLNNESEELEVVEGPGFVPGDISFNGEPWNRETNPIDIPFLPDWINDSLNDEVENSPKKAEQIGENPNLLIDKVFEIFPATMFVLLPVVALIFKFWYLFAKRYYVEHLIFSLHNHAFIFVCLIFVLIFNETADLLLSRGLDGPSKALQWLDVAIWIWIPLYLLVSLRVVYQQGWLLTLLKFMVIGISYVTLLSVVTLGVALASFIML
jgi:hypothetical protein